MKRMVKYTVNGNGKQKRNHNVKETKAHVVRMFKSAAKDCLAQP